MRRTTSEFDCKKCNSGKVKIDVQERKNDVEVMVRKCDHCKYQYGLKEIYKENGIGLKIK